MSARIVWEVSRWEFMRYFKPKQQIIGMLFTALVGMATILITHFASRTDPLRIAVIGFEHLPVQEQSREGLLLLAHDAGEEAELRAAVNDGEIDGLLLVRDTDHAELVVRRRRDWTDDVTAALAASRQQVVLQRSGMNAQQLTALLAPPELSVSELAARTGSARRERVTLVITVSLMMFVLFMGMSFIFTSITGEKQIRVTEQVVSAVPAQSWIDGKILGLTGISLVSVINTIIAMALSLLALPIIGARLPIPSGGGDPIIVLVIVLFGLLGLLFWFAFLGVIAAMIDDPHTSTRGSFLFMPLFATSLGFLALGNPDGGLVRILALLPPTAPAAMPARMLRTEVHPLEIVLSLLLLAAAAHALRIAAGRIFRTAMLMYGKEPTWNEVRRWAFERQEPGK